MYGAELFPDVEATLVTFLRAALTARAEPYAADVHVSNALPNPRPARAVIVRRDGGRRLDNIREAARVGVNVWAATEKDANDLSRMVSALLHSQAPVPVMHVDTISALSPLSDESGQPRRFGTFEVILTSSPLI